jgi:DNA-binding LytR/AlgR family response regulator
MKKNSNSPPKISLVISDLDLVNRLRILLEEHNFEILPSDSSSHQANASLGASHQVIVQNKENSILSALQAESLKEYLRIYKINHAIQLVEWNKVSHIIASKDICTVFLNQGVELISLKPLAYYQKAFGNRMDFFRVHNNTLVNVHQISEYNKKDNLLIMKSGARIVCSRRKGRELYFQFFLK